MSVKRELPLENTLDEFHSYDTLLYDLVMMKDPFLKGGFMIENPRVVVSFPLLGITYVVHPYLTHLSLSCVDNNLWIPS